jgi:hypothetical protein
MYMVTKGNHCAARTKYPIESSPTENHRSLIPHLLHETAAVHISINVRRGWHGRKSFWTRRGRKAAARNLQLEWVCMREESLETPIYMCVYIRMYMYMYNEKAT